jgi:hypothetical protein
MWVKKSGQSKAPEKNPVWAGRFNVDLVFLFAVKFFFPFSFFIQVCALLKLKPVLVLNPYLSACSGKYLQP